MAELTFDFASGPPTWDFCFNEHCPRKETCMHYFAGRHLPEDNTEGFAIYPNALQNGKCKFYASSG